MHALRARRLGTFALVLVAVIGAAGCTEFRKNRHLKRGDAYYADKKYKEAILEYRNVLRFEKENPHAIARLGLAHFTQGELGQAYAFLNKAADLTPDDVEVRLRLGTIQLLARKPEQARVNAEFVLTKDPNNLGALTLMADTSNTDEELDSAIAAIEAKKASLGDPVRVGRVLGSLYLRKRNVPKAEEAFKEAVAAKPQSAEAQISLASLHQAKGEVDQAETEFKAAANAEPQDPAGKLRLADFYLQQKRPDDARRILVEITTKNPDYLPAWLRTSELAVAERKWDDALKALDPVFKKNPDERTGLMIKGQVELSKSLTSEAIQTYRQVLKANAKYAPGHYQLALAHVQNADPEQARTELREAISITPTYSDAILLLADLDIQSGHFDPAIEALQKLIGDFPKVPMPRAHELLGAAYLRKKEPAKATAEYREILKMAPKDPRALMLVAAGLRAEGKEAEARKILEGAAADAPQALEPLSRLVAMDMADKRPDAAVARIKRAMEKAPQVASLYFLLGSVYRAKGDLDLAVGAHQKAIELEPRAFGSYRELAQIYARQQKTDEALAQLAHAAELAPKNASVQVLTGMLQQQKGEVAKARQAYEKALALDPRSVVAANNLAVIVAFEDRDLEKALVLAKKAKELAPEDPSITDTLGWIYYQRSIYELALALLRQASEKVPANQEIHYHYGMALLKTGDKAGARRELTAALAGTPTFEGVDEAKKALEGLGLPEPPIAPR